MPQVGLLFPTVTAGNPANPLSSGRVVFQGCPPLLGGEKGWQLKPIGEGEDGLRPLS